MIPSTTVNREVVDYIETRRNIAQFGISDSMRAPPQPAAQAINAVKVYGRGETTVRALDGVTVTFAKGQFSAIMGPSGSGKSTLLHCLAGLDRLTSGTVHIGEIELGSLGDRQLTLLRRVRVGFIFQSFNLVPTLSAYDNIVLPLTIAGRKQVIGRPILYRTSKEFLMRFGLGDLDELPSLKEFEALAREALGTDDGIAEAAPEETPPDASAEAAPPPESAPAPGAESAAASDPAAPTGANPIEGPGDGPPERNERAARGGS